MAKSTNKDASLINPGRPTFVDSSACNLAVKIDETVRGSKDSNIIWRPETPSWNFGKNSLITAGAKKIAITVRTMEPNIAEYVIFLFDFPLDASDNKKECKTIGRRPNANKTCKLNW